jgi:transposase
MSNENRLLSELLDLKHVRVLAYQLKGSGDIEIKVESTLSVALCPECQSPSDRVHEVSSEQKIRDLSLWQRRCWLRYEPRRFKCERCQSTFVERVAWRESGLNYTIRYETFLYERVRRETIAQVAKDEGVSEDIVTGVFERLAKKK